MMNKKGEATFGLSGSFILLIILVYILFFTKISIAKLISNPIVIVVAIIIFVALSSKK